MRKPLLLAGLAALAVAAVTAASLALSVPARASSVGPSVSGIGTLGQFGDPTVRVSAIEAGFGPQGGLAVSYPDGTRVVATDTCVFVSGTTAYVTGRILIAVGPRVAPANFSRGNYVIVGIMDNGGTTPDLLNFSSGFAANPGCGPNFAATPVFPIVKGRFLIHDR